MSYSYSMIVFIRYVTPTLATSGIVRSVLYCLFKRIFECCAEAYLDCLEVIFRQLHTLGVSSKPHQDSEDIPQCWSPFRSITPMPVYICMNRLLLHSPRNTRYTVRNNTDPWIQRTPCWHAIAKVTHYTDNHNAALQGSRSSLLNRIIILVTRI